MLLKFIVSQIQSEDWFVTIDVKDGCIHTFLLDSARILDVSQVHFWGILSLSLALSPHAFMKCMNTDLAPLQLQGISVLI